MRSDGTRQNGRPLVSAPRDTQQNAPPVVRKVVHLRIKKGLCPVEIASRIGVPSSIVHAVQTRCHLNRRSQIDIATGEPARRSKRNHPGAPIHVEVKKLDKIPDRGGWRTVGLQRAWRNRAVAPGKQRSQHRGVVIPHAFVHAGIYHRSRVVCAGIRDDEIATTAVGVLIRAVTWFAARGVYA